MFQSWALVHLKICYYLPGRGWLFIYENYPMASYVRVTILHELMWGEKTQILWTSHMPFYSLIWLHTATHKRRFLEGPLWQPAWPTVLCKARAFLKFECNLYNTDNCQPVTKESIQVTEGVRLDPAVVEGGSQRGFLGRQSCWGTYMARLLGREVSLASPHIHLWGCCCWLFRIS